MIVIFLVAFSSAQLTYGNLTEVENQFVPCPDFSVTNGKVHVETQELFFIQIATITCWQPYHLIGPEKFNCVEGNWRPPQKSECVMKCRPPPFLTNGGVQIEGEKTVDGKFKEGARATYSCGEKFELVPAESKLRFCVDGVWSGVDGTCQIVRDGCKSPEQVKNGYYVQEKEDDDGVYEPGDRLHYSCNNGYSIVGTTTQTCLEDGSWSPRIPPKCIQNHQVSTNFFNQPEGLPCSPLPIERYARTIPRRYPLTSGTEVEIKCVDHPFPTVESCSTKVKCVDGNWIGEIPECNSRECPPPPAVLHATVYNINDFTRPQRFVRNVQVSYQCYPGYELRGHEILTCSSGCWTPRDPPICVEEESYFADATSSSQILASLGSGVCVLLLLVVICFIVLCKRKKPLTRAVTIQPSVPRPDMGDHAALLHPPDRLALIAFADGIQTAQPVLPTYEEAIRDNRGTGYIAARVHRPHWPSLATRRSRNSPNPDSIHVTRQGSFASHSASLRSDPMGSTDTMAVSENSTTVTLETASSHSGSQPASCRAHCGSLASFDTSSVLNNEGVPLLEENELEEVQSDSISLAMENRSMADSSSFKLSTGSDLP